MSAQKRHIPVRTCVICGNKASKRELTRIVATADGAVQIDTTSRLPGRGAYFCSSGDCRLKGLNRERLEYALRTKISDEGWGHFSGTAEMVGVSPGSLGTRNGDL
jgi:hypothetical protein